MAWSASVISKSVSNGSVLVTVEYSDGSSSFREDYRAIRPSASWIPNTVRDRIASLNDLSSYSIDVGSVIPSEFPSIDPNIALFRSRVRALEAVKVMIDLGAVRADNAKVVALINWIKNNVSTYFDNL